MAMWSKLFHDRQDAYIHCLVGNHANTYIKLNNYEKEVLP